VIVSRVEERRSRLRLVMASRSYIVVDVIDGRGEEIDGMGTPFLIHAVEKGWAD
jgi:hypothetical protein